MNQPDGTAEQTIIDLGCRGIHRGDGDLTRLVARSRRARGLRLCGVKRFELRAGISSSTSGISRGRSR